MHKLRFATAIPHFSKKKGGAEKYLVDLCTRMVREDFEVHVYSEHWDEENSGVHFHQVRTIPFPKSLRLLLFAIWATQAIEAENYDITLGVGNTLRADVLQPHGGVHWAWFWRSLKAYDHPIVWLIKFLGRIVSPKQWVQGYIESAPFRKKAFKKVVAISDMVKKDIMKWYRVPEHQIEVIYNGVDTERFHPRNRRYREEIRKRHGIGDEFVILFVSNNFRMKGLSYLIKALAEIKKEAYPSVKLLVLGRDRQGPYLRLARKWGISENILFAGSTDEPEKYYGAVDLLVHPTFYDACSLTVMEALSSGVPVVTTGSNGANGVFSDGQGGFIIRSPRDQGLLKERITYLRDENKRREFSLDARIGIERFSGEVNYSSMKSLFLKVAQTRKLNDAR